MPTRESPIGWFDGLMSIGIETFKSGGLMIGVRVVRYVRTHPATDDMITSFSVLFQKHKEGF